MTKADMINELEWRHPNDFPSHSAAERSFNTVLEIIKEDLLKNGSVVVSGFGTFMIVDRAERVARNPQDGTEVIVPAHKSIRFKPAKALKAKVN